MTSIQDWSFYSIPAAFVMASLPQVWLEVRMGVAIRGMFTNVV